MATEFKTVQKLKISRHFKELIMAFSPGFSRTFHDFPGCGHHEKIGLLDAITKWDRY